MVIGIIQLSIYLRELTNFYHMLFTTTKPILRCLRRLSTLITQRPPRPKFFDDGNTLHYEIAVPADMDMLMRFQLEQFLPSDVYSPAIRNAYLSAFIVYLCYAQLFCGTILIFVDLTEEDVIDSYNDALDRDLPGGACIMGFIESELITCSLNRTEYISFGHKQITDFTTPEWNKLKDDYQEGDYLV